MKPIYLVVLQYNDRSGFLIVGDPQRSFREAEIMRAAAAEAATMQGFVMAFADEPSIEEFRRRNA